MSYVPMVGRPSWRTRMAVVLIMFGSPVWGAAAPTDETGRFVSTVLAQTESTWTELFREVDRAYEKPWLVLFSGSTQSACGVAQARMGPFYCAADRKIYLDPGMLEQLSRDFGAAGDIAAAYVIAHQVGHHVQNLLDRLPKAPESQQGSEAAQAARLSLQLELQADCFAGIWASRSDAARRFLEAGAARSMFDAVSAMSGKLREQSGDLVADALNHGSVDQRMRWFLDGFNGRILKSCDTSATEPL